MLKFPRTLIKFMEDPKYVLAAQIAGWCLVLGSTYYWLHGGEFHQIREQLGRSHFWLLEINFILMAVLGIVNVMKILTTFSTSGVKQYAPLFSIVVLVIILLSISSQTNRIYYDEQIYQGIGQNLSDLKTAQMCNDGIVEYGKLSCNRGEYNKQPYGYPYLLSVAYRIFGTSESTSWFVNNASFILLIGVVYLLALLLFENRKTALFSSLVMALIPHQILWSNSASVEPSASLFVAATVLCAVWFSRDKTISSLLWLVSTASFATQFRPESILCIPLAILTILLFSPRELLKPRMWWSALLGYCFSIFLIGHMFIVRNESWGSPGPRISLDYFQGNIKVNAPFYFKNVRFPAIYSLLAILGSITILRKEVLLLFAYFAVFMGIFLFFYAGSYNYGADIRYSLMTYPPLAILAGRGLSVLIEFCSNKLQTQYVPTLLAALIVFNFLSFVPLIRSDGEEAWGARADVRFARNFVKNLPENSIVLTHNPSMFHLWGVNAAQASIATNEPDYIRYHLSQRFAGGIYFHWNFWCNVTDPFQNSFCTNFLDKYSTNLIEEKRVRTYRYAFYKVNTEEIRNNRAPQRLIKPAGKG